MTIWVDDWPIDWDYDCDGTADQPDPRDASGFDNCDLSIIADAIDANIYPTLNATFGDVPTSTVMARSPWSSLPC